MKFKKVISHPYSSRRHEWVSRTVPQYSTVQFQPFEGRTGLARRNISLARRARHAT
jgi:hypothetical protein